MDHELKNLVLNINQLAALSGLHRQTVVARLKTGNGTTHSGQ